jgi:excisionase family DNA binding protein
MLRDKYLSTQEAAKLLGFTADHIRRLILQDHIKAEKIGNSWMIKPKDIANIKRRRKPKGTSHGDS